MEFFLPQVVPRSLNIFETNLFKILFYIPEITFYVNESDPIIHHIPTKYCERMNLCNVQ